MDIKNRCKVFFDNDPQSAPISPVAPALVISGRVAVHSVIGSSWGVVLGAAGTVKIMNMRPYYLCASADHSDVSFKFVPLLECGVYSGGSFQFNMGGNGILFENGVYLGRSDTAANGETPFDVTHAITIIYTGGANA